MTRRDLVAVDETAVVADYEAGATVAAMTEHRDIGLTRLYRILDRHQVPRRRPNAPKLPKRLRERILAEYRAGDPVDDIAHRHGVSVSTVCNFAERAGITRTPRRTHDDLVDLIVRWFVGEHIADEERDAITRVGCRTRQPGLRSLERLDPVIAADVRRRLVAVLTEM